jgi:lysozyme
LEDTGPSASEAAAAAVSARLGALLRDSEPEPKALEAPAEPPADALVTETEAEAAGQPLPEDEPTIAEAAGAQDIPAEVAPEDTLIEAEGQEVPRDIDVVSTDPKPITEDVEAAPHAAESVFTPKLAAKPEPMSILVWVGMGFLGLALFAAAVKFGFKAPPAGSIGGMDPVVMGLGLGIVGIGCTAVAVYQLLMRLAGPVAPPAA